MIRLVESARVGSRGASKVRVSRTRPSRYSGLVGIVVRVPHDGSVMVRFPSGIVLPFAIGELEVLA